METLGSVQAAFEQAPRVFKAVRMNPARHVGHGVIDYLMLEVIKPFVRL